MPASIPKTVPDQTAVSAWMPVELAQALRLKAALNNRTMSAEIRDALIAHLHDERPGGNQGACQNTGGGAGHVQV